MDKVKLSRLRAQWLRCVRCYNELTKHERTTEGGYCCTRCGNVRALIGGRRNG